MSTKSKMLDTEKGMSTIYNFDRYHYIGYRPTMYINDRRILVEKEMINTDLMYRKIGTVNDNIDKPIQHIEM